MTIKGKAASVEFRNVTKAFGEVVAVRDVSFKIDAGELITFLGPSGCGKTTTLRMIAGLEMTTSGQILIGDTEVTHLPATDRDVSMVFQSYALFPHMTVAENVGYGLRVGGLDKAAAMQQASDGLNVVGLKGYEGRLPSELSGGQQQRVAVARALVLEPQVLLFDEPLSNLDAKLRRRMREEIRDLQKDLGLTVVYVTHDQSEALAVSDRIVVMKDAVIAQVGSPHDLYERPVDTFVADFIGDANLVEGEILKLNNGDALVKIGGLEVERPHQGLKPGPTQMAIRPEAIKIAKDTGDGKLRGNVAKAAYLGSHLEYTVISELGELFVIDHDLSSPVAQGESVEITFAERGVNLVRAEE
ncbi:MAG: ABC transporter ATP-binding protein [Rhodospirillales bacterium]|nr:ABC transporter ATP-binding protein [Rhodospirillales bacterium]